MKESDLRALIEDVRDGALSRRRFIDRLARLGIGAPLASMLLAHSGVARAQPAAASQPIRRGGGGPLKTIFWQGPTLLQPHFAGGSKDQE